MASRRLAVVAAAGVVFAGPVLPLSPTAQAAGHNLPAHAAQCSPGARTLAPSGSRLYPDTGNGGYQSVHTDVRLVYDAVRNQFLAGNHVVLTDRATQCLTSFSLDFERRSLANQALGPDLRVRSITVNGRPAAFRFARPAYPGDPHGPDDPNPLAHQASQLNPVGGPQHNPLPPACTPQLKSANANPNSQNGEQCQASKLVITPAMPVRNGSLFTVAVYYTGRPGVHTDGDGTTEGWFASNQPPGDGGFVTTEPVGTEDWMPLNDFPSAKPTYDFYNTVTAGRTVVANGILEWSRRNPPDARFPHGSVTWHWHSAAPVASYLVEDSVGRYLLSERTAPGGVRFYQAQASSLSPAQRTKNQAIMSMQQDITRFQSLFNGRYPFRSDGVVVGRPSASFDEEMQTMIAFSGGQIDTQTLYHENMHQWWGDHVSEASYNLTFFKEGLATLGEYFYHARQAQAAAGGPSTPAGRHAFERSLISQFNTVYASKGIFWTAAPSNPEPYGLFSGSATYARPGIAYVALRRILGPARFAAALRQIQRQFGDRSITEPQLEAGFARWLPDQRPACRARLSQFFAQWFDTAYPAGGRAHRPQITGPGLAGPGFSTASCPA